MPPDAPEFIGPGEDSATPSSQSSIQASQPSQSAGFSWPKTNQPYPGAGNYLDPDAPPAPPVAPTQTSSAQPTPARVAPAAAAYGYGDAPAYDTAYRGQQMQSAQACDWVTLPPGYSQAPLQIGGIQVTGTEVITPQGRIPLAGARFEIRDMTVASTRTPTWAIICAVVFFFLIFMFSLFFLLAKEDQVQGSIGVSVQGSGLDYYTIIPVFTVQQRTDLIARVQYAQNLAGRPAC